MKTYCNAIWIVVSAANLLYRQLIASVRDKWSTCMNKFEALVSYSLYIFCPRSILQIPCSHDKYQYHSLPRTIWYKSHTSFPLFEFHPGDGTQVLHQPIGQRNNEVSPICQQWGYMYFSFTLTHLCINDKQVWIIILRPLFTPQARRCKHHVDGLMQDRRNSIANTLELCLSCTKPSKYDSISIFN